LLLKPFDDDGFTAGERIMTQSYEYEIEVRFRDCDALGHVNNAVYLTYLEQARFALWQRITGRTGVFADASPNIILARVECDYRAPARMGDRLVVRTRVSAIGRSSFTLDYEILDARTRSVVANARTVQVVYDYGAGRSLPIPDDIRARLDA
jgi:acyl-CoA thioester hydrolase